MHAIRSRTITFTLAAAALGAVALAGTAGGSAAQAQSKAIQRTVEVATFDRVRISGSFDAEVTVGPARSVVAHGAAADVDRLTFAVENGELRIDSKGRWSLGRQPPVVVRITVPSLTALALSGSGDLTARGVSAKQFAASLAGSGDLQVEGRCERASLSVAGSGDLDAGALRCSAVIASVAGSGDLIASASQDAAASVVGSGDIVIRGNPAKRAPSRMGSGDIRFE